MGICTLISNQLLLHCVAITFGVIEMDRAWGINDEENTIKSFVQIYHQAMRDERSTPNTFVFAPNWITPDEVKELKHEV